MTCCDHCVTRQGFGQRRLRVYALLIQHPEWDLPSFRGVLHAETDRNGQVRGEVREKSLPPLIEPEHAA